jgi:hypothetical protein
MIEVDQGAIVLVDFNYSNHMHSKLRHSTNHFIPVGRRPDWKIFIDSLAIQVRTLLSQAFE